MPNQLDFYSLSLWIAGLEKKNHHLRRVVPLSKVTQIQFTDNLQNAGHSNMHSFSPRTYENRPSFRHPRVITTAFPIPPKY
jgi:hypothetical protein